MRVRLGGRKPTLAHMTARTPRSLCQKAVRGLLAVSLFGMAACSSVEQAAPPVAQLRSPTPACERGRELYLTKCTKCHSPEPIREHSLTDWSSDILPTMVRKSKLGPSDGAAVEAYVRAVLATPPAPPKS
jgi:mono/diheme cytochrome c family protein